ncbi:hypothetical protein SAMN05444004_101466 [Jannaschia faecimaris]|uniref:Uncharacterized protein n=1 Tax=Jannaschia faecimaris TaxID=1244108 RepID=A0A1H3JYU1_9RHOB|nr:hypothetical protein [Jannaschia faecimaris]SDY44799.1 hypothetical protein SAMN05444004_101466 [Jannaschia faecimaris]
MQTLGFISDVLLLAATCGMALWCRTLARRLRAFNDLDAGHGGSIATLTLQVDDLKESITAATEQTDDRSALLKAANAQADDRIGRMEMLLASLEDLEDEAADRVLDNPIPERADVLPSFKASRQVDASPGAYR